MSGAATVASALRAAVARLGEAGIAEAELDARRLVMLAAGIDALALVVAGERPLPADRAAALEAMLARRARGEPVGRIEGRRAFWGREFRLSPGTLEPRPDSEALIEAALDWRARRPPGAVRLLDLGTGTGCLAVTLLAEWPEASGIAVDLSEDACRTARANAADHGVTARSLVIRSDWDAALPDRAFELIVSNPPYISSAEMARLAPEVARHDPALALDGGADGLDAYRALARAVPRLLAPGGRALFEIGAGQADEVRALAAEAGLAFAGERRDLGGHVRVLAFDDAELR